MFYDRVGPNTVIVIEPGWPRYARYDDRQPEIAMNNLLKTLFFLGFLLTSSLKAMDAPSSLPSDSIPILIVHGPLDIGDFLNMSELSHFFNEYFGEEQWRKVYWHQTKAEKVRPLLSFKQNCQVLNHAYALIHTSPPECALITDYSLVAEHKIDFRDLPTCSSMVNLEPFLSEAAKKRPLVFATCFGPLKNEQSLKKYKEIYDSLRDQDILFIVPAGNDGYSLKAHVADFDIHQRWPNILWVGAIRDGLLANSNHGPLVHVAVPSPKGTSNAALSLASLVIQMRRLRLDLRAPEIIKILVETCTTSDEIKNLLPNGGFLDTAKAIEALKKYNH